MAATPTTPSSDAALRKAWLDKALDEKHIKLIPYNDFQNVNLVARGGFGEISSAFWPSGQRVVALKKLNRNPDNEDPDSWIEFVNEVWLVPFFLFFLPINYFHSGC